VTRFGLFVKLLETGADGLVPVRSLPSDYYHHDEQHHRLVGKRFRRVFTLGDSVEVRLAEADVVTGGLILALLSDTDEAPARATRGRDKSGDRLPSGGPPGRQPGTRRGGRRRSRP